MHLRKYCLRWHKQLRISMLLKISELLISIVQHHNFPGTRHRTKSESVHNVLFVRVKIIAEYKLNL